MSSPGSLSPRERILACALREFSRFGYFGARVARITRAARVSPRMLFYYFKSKKGLFNAVQQSIWQRTDTPGDAPLQPADDLKAWYQFYASNLDWARILLWEGLEQRKMQAGEEAQRKSIWQENLRKMAARTDVGGWPSALDLPHLLLSLLAVQLAPIALPHQARMLTGKDPFSPEFVRERQAFFDRWLETIQAKPARAKRRTRKRG